MSEPLPTAVAPDQPYWVWANNGWLKFQNLAEFIHWHGQFDSTEWDWLMIEDVSGHLAVQRDMPGGLSPVGRVIEQLQLQGAKTVLAVSSAGVERVYDFGDPQRPNFVDFAHRALCAIYRVMRAN